MTTRHVVADDIFGKISKRTWELHRRVLEGTLDPISLLEKLQALAEGKPIHLPVESPLYALSDKFYSIKVGHRGDFFRFANQHFTGLDRNEKYSSWDLLPGPTKSRVRLLEWKRHMTLPEMMRVLDHDRIRLADPWELVAFGVEASFTKVLSSEYQHVLSLVQFGQRKYETSTRYDPIFLKLKCDPSFAGARTPWKLGLAFTSHYEPFQMRPEEKIYVLVRS
jgi:hypothetical protein